MHLRKLIFASILLTVVAFGQVWGPVPVTLDTAYQVKYMGNLNIADAYINIANTGAINASPFGPGSQGGLGGICVNVYAFSMDEQMVNCCTCPVTANGHVSLSAQKDILSNTLTPYPPTSLLVKLLATVPSAANQALTYADFLSKGCTDAQLLPADAVPANGLAAWGTTTHVTPAGSTLSETPFTPSTLSIGESARLRNLCTLMKGNGSGYGICKTCKPGALAATKK